MTRKPITLTILAVLALTAAACATEPTEPAASVVPGDIQTTFSDEPRSDAAAPSSDVSELVDGNTRFAFDLYRTLSAQEGNLFLSPHSISLALAMTYAGASGETEAEMQQALHFTLEQMRLHAAMNSLDQTLAERGQDAPEDERLRLEMANSLWGQQGFPFEQAFLDTLAENYGAGMRLVDFVDPEIREQTRRAINQWVEEETEDRIKDLIPEGVIDDMTRLVLVNAIYFKASWLRQFDEDATADAEFTLLDGSTVTTPMMNKPTSNTPFNYGRGDGYQAIELPYVGESASMVVLLPEEGGFEAFEEDLDADRLDEIIAGMSRDTGRIALPKFEFESKFSLPDALEALGMEQAFDERDAEFMRMSPEGEGLYIKDVIHQAFVAVDETGTEAAAATAVTMQALSMPAEAYEFVADRPFIFLIRDIESGAVLFLGRLLDPTG